MKLHYLLLLGLNLTAWPAAAQAAPTLSAARAATTAPAPSAALLPASAAANVPAAAVLPAWQTRLFDEPEQTLPVLVEAAQSHSPELQVLQTQQAVGEEDLRLARKAILGGLQLSGGYGYGNVANMTVADPNLPKSYATTASNRYAAAVNLSLGLDKLLGRGNMLEKQRLLNEQTTQLTKARLKGLRQQVLEQYQAVLLARKVLLLRQQALVSAQLNQQLGEQQFRSGDLSLADYSQLTDRYAGAQVDHETAASAYATALLLLEEAVGEPLAALLSRP